MGTQPVVDYCRHIEAHLCQKNDGHLIRIVGPSFDRVSGWAANGVPLKIALRGIDRYFERYYRQGPRRRPVRIDFCEADVLDLFDEWRRAIGVPLAVSAPPAVATGDEAGAVESDARRAPSLPSHLRRAVLRLSQARATGLLGVEAEELIDRTAHELDRARASSRGLRGEARRALLARLSELDAELLRIARAALNEADRRSCEGEAEDELAGFRDRLSAEGYLRAREAAIDRLVRERFGLPTVTFI